jgi:hypothetical protein
VTNVVAADGPDAAGNTPVIEVPGPRPSLNGVQQVQPSSNQAAAMPGGVTGGDRFVVPHLRHLNRHTSSKSGLVSELTGAVEAPWSWISLAIIAGLAFMVILRRRRPAELVATVGGPAMSRRHRRRRLPKATAPLAEVSARPGTDLLPQVAEKGERS